MCEDILPKLIEIYHRFIKKYMKIVNLSVKEE